MQSVLLRDLTEACRCSPELNPRCLAPALDCVLLSVLRHSNFEDSTCIRGHRPVFPSTVMHTVRQILPPELVPLWTKSLVGIAFFLSRRQ